jgi:hypothetical protein
MIAPPRKLVWTWFIVFSRTGEARVAIIFDAVYRAGLQRTKQMMHHQCKLRTDVQVAATFPTQPGTWWFLTNLIWTHIPHTLHDKIRALLRTQHCCLSARFGAVSVNARVPFAMCARPRRSQ